MKLTVIIADQWSPVAYKEHTGQEMKMHKRSVQIELTPEQIELLKRKNVGQSGSTQMYEVYQECFIEEGGTPVMIDHEKDDLK